MPARPKLADPGQLIRSAKRRTDTYDLCTDPELVEEYERILDELSAEQVAAKQTLAAGGRAAELREQLDDVLARGASVTVTLTFQALARSRYRALVDQHPPRKNDQGEILDGRSRALGIDYDPFFMALLPLSLVSPDLDEDTLTHLMDEVLTDRQWKDVTTVVWNLNNASVDVPFSPAVSPKTPRSSRR